MVESALAVLNRLKPGLTGIAVPYALSYRPVWTGLGLIAGYLALLLGPTFYLRKRIGTRRWRKLHRSTTVVWLLCAAHALGSGSDAGTVWLRAIVLLPAVPIIYLLTVRLLPGSRPAPAPTAAHTRRTHPVRRQRGAEPALSRASDP